MTKPKVFVTRRIPGAGLDMLWETCDVEVWEDELPPVYDTLKAKAAESVGLLTLLSDRIDQELLRSSPNLRVVSQCAVGVDNIDITAATAAHVPVGHTPGVLTDTTADFAFALLMAAARRIAEAARYVHAGQWKTWGPTLLMGQDIGGATLGIIGMGRIGQAMARRGRGFDMRVLYSDQKEVPAATDLGAERKALDEVLTEADFVSLHVPLTPETYHLIDNRALKLMKKTAVLVNTARGPVIDPKALYLALKEGEIAYAALDVTEPEPILQDDPLLTLDNCLIVPHIASSSVKTRSKMAVMAAENLLAGLAGIPLPYCANPAVYGK